MNTYRVIWLVLCASLALVGASVAFLVSPAALLFLFLTFAIISPIWTLAAVNAIRKRPPRHRTRLVATSALVGGTIAGSFVGFAVTLGAGVFLLFLFGLISSPYVVSAYSRWLYSASPEYTPLQSLTELQLLTDEQLCQRWRVSYMGLQEGSSCPEMMMTAEERQTYLDEFERRNASGLAALARVWRQGGG